MTKTDIEVLMGSVASVVRGYVASATAEIGKRLDATDQRVAAIPAAEPVDVAAIVAEVKAQVTPAEVDYDRIGNAIKEIVDDLPVPKDGASITVADVAPLIVEEVQKAVAALPPAEPGKPGADASLEMVKAVVAETVAQIPAAQPGKDCDPAAVAALVMPDLRSMVEARANSDDARINKALADMTPLIAENVAKAVAAIPPGIEEFAALLIKRLQAEPACV